MCRQLGSRVTGQRHPLPPPAVCPPRGDVPNPEGRSNETPSPSTLPHAPFHPSGPQRGSVQRLMGQKRKKKAEKARDAALQAVPSLAVPVPSPSPATRGQGAVPGRRAISCSSASPLLHPDFPPPAQRGGIVRLSGARRRLAGSGRGREAGGRGQDFFFLREGAGQNLGRAGRGDPWRWLWAREGFWRGYSGMGLALEAAPRSSEHGRNKELAFWPRLSVSTQNPSSSAAGQ